MVLTMSAGGGLGAVMSRLDATVSAAVPMILPVQLLRGAAAASEAAVEMDVL